MARAYFVDPAFAETASLTLRIEAASPGVRSRTVTVPHEHVIYVVGHVGDLASVERTLSSVTLRVRADGGVDEQGMDNDDDDDDIASFTAKIIARAEEHRGAFAALVAGRHAKPLDADVALGRVRRLQRSRVLDPSAVELIRYALRPPGGARRW